MELQNHRYIELDSLRGIAAVTVVFGHFLSIYQLAHWQAVFNASPLRVLTAAHEAVIIFFLLSGFVLAIPFSKKQKISYFEYLVKRICRIWIPYVAAVALAGAGSHLLFSPVPTGNPWIDQTWNQRPSLHLILQHLVMIGHYDSVQLNTAFWSLIYEMRISLAYPVMYWVSRRYRARWVLPIAFCFTLIAAIFADRRGSEGLCYNVLYAAFFLMGTYLQRNLPLLSVWFRAQTSAIKILCVVVCLISFDGPGAFPAIVVRGSRFIPIFMRDWVTMLGAVGILFFAIELGRFRHFLHHPVILRLGTISYSIYLVHATVLFAFIRLFYPKPYFPLLFPLYVLITYVMAEGLHYACERPAMLLGRRLGERIRSKIV
jgi:peptidoglycan/LPS O-acetylase OafA/YrhL